MDAEVIQEIGRFIERNYLLIALVLGAFIQVSPIKIYPLDLLKGALKWVGRQIMENVDKKLDTIEKKVDKLEKEADDKRIKDLRFLILDFDHSILSVDYSREAYEHIIFDIHHEYEQLLAKYEMTNGKVDRAMKRINEKYETHLSDPSF